MADISKIDNGTEYNLKDATARADIESSKTIKSSVVTVNDAAPINAEDITVDITPQQDLHGYDRPWAGGAWKNKLPMTVAGIKAANTSGTWDGNSYTFRGVTFSLKSDDGVSVTSISTSGISSGDIYFNCGAMPLSNNTNYILSGCAASGNAGTYSLYLYRDESETLLVRDIDESGIPFTAVSTFSSIVNLMVRTGINMDSKVFYPMIRLSTETDSTFAPYSNNCLIEGRTGAGLDRAGKNWCGDLSIGVWLGRTGDFDPSFADYTSSQKIKIFPSTTYTFTCDVGGTSKDSDILFYDKNGAYLGRESSIFYAYLASKTFVSPNNAYYATFSVAKRKDDVGYFQLELGTQPTTYEPYQGQQYTASFGETVYGGKWHVTEGGTDKTYGNIANYNGETINEPWLSSLDEYSPGATPTIGAQVVYPLTTPTTISTRKQNVPMLQGINTVYADCGDTQLKYQPDNVIGELKGEIESVNERIDSAMSRESYSGSPHSESAYDAYFITIVLRRLFNDVDIYKIYPIFYQRVPVTDYTYTIQDPVDSKYIPNTGVSQTYMHISGKAWLTISLSSAGKLQVRLQVLEPIEDTYADIYWLKTCTDPAFNKAKY